jgi:tetratricopeptide (TPR) repeat protein
MFFFAAALVSRFAYPPARTDESNAFSWPVPLRLATAGALLVALAMVYNAGARGLNVALHGAALASANPERAEQLYRAALSWDPTDPGTHYNYGLRLFYGRRASEAVPHLRYAVARGLNASVCYGNLASAEAIAGDAQAAERTLAFAVGVYPRSVFLRVRHGFALETVGQAAAAEREYDVALSLDSKVARGWWQLMHYGVDAAGLAARQDQGIALPGSLYPENCILAELAAIEMRAPELAAKKKDFLPASMR